MKKVSVIVCMALLAACNSGETVKTEVKAAISKAYIFERKLLPGDKLMVSYTYQNGQRTVKDSSVIAGKTILQDSVPVSLLAKNGR